MIERLNVQNDALRELIKLIHSELEQMRLEAAQNEAGEVLVHDTKNSEYRIHSFTRTCSNRRAPLFPNRLHTLRT